MGEAAPEDVDGHRRRVNRYDKLSAHRAHRFHATLHALEVAVTLSLLFALGAYTEAAHRSAALRTHFQEILAEMRDPLTKEQREEELLRTAATLVIADVDRWRDASAHRVMATF